MKAWPLLALLLGGCVAAPPPPETSVSCRDSVAPLKGDGRDRLQVDFCLPHHSLHYAVTLDPGRPGMPAKDTTPWTPNAPHWNSIGDGTGIGTWFMELRRDASADVFLVCGLRAWGVAESGGRQFAVMSWADASGAPPATLLATPVPGGSWTAFVIVPGGKAEDKVELAFENLPTTYWCAMGSTRCRAVANADVDFPLDRTGRQWQIDQRRCWAFCHNLDSQQLSGRAYLFAPMDFATLGAKESQLGATPRPGRKLLRLAMSDFSGQPWPEALEEKRREIPAALAFISSLELDAPFQPTRAQTAAHAWLRSLPGLEAEGYFRLFDKLQGQGLRLDELVEFLRLERDTEQQGSKLADQLPG